MFTKKHHLNKDILQGIILALVIIILGALIIWGLGTFSDALKAQLV